MPDIGIPVPLSRTIIRGRAPNPNSMSGRIRALKVGESEFFARKQSIVGAAVHAQHYYCRVPVGVEYVTRKEGVGTRVFRVK